MTNYIIAIFGIVVLMATYKIYLDREFYRHLFELEDFFESELDFTSLSKNILIRLMKETNSTSGMIYWLDETQNDFKLKTLNGIPTDKISVITRILRQPQGFIEKIAGNPQGFIIKDFKNDDYFKKMEESQELAAFYQSLMVIPLTTVENKILGILLLFKDQSIFTNRQLNLLTVFAPRLAVRLDNARLYQVTRETALENSRLYVNISKLYHQATLDELTGLANRMFLIQRMKEELKKASRFQQPISLIFVDIDNFKNVNAKYSHQIGDQVLIEFADLLRNSIREYDVASRFGGEEFVLLLPQASLTNSVELAERLREKVANTNFCAAADGLNITASFGVSAIMKITAQPNQLDDERLTNYVESLVSRADDALGEAKNSGRNKVVYRTEEAEE